MKIKSIIIGLSLITTFLLSGCGKKEEEKTTVPKLTEEIPVKVMDLTKTDVAGTIHSSGQFTTDDETLLSFKTGGVINKIYVKEGDLVKKGEVLATLDLTEISAQVNQAQIGLDKANRDYKRVENLFKDSVATLEQLQNTKSGLEIAQQQLAGAKFNLSYSEIRATHDGVVLKKIAQEGQIVGSGMPVIQTSGKGQCDWILRVALSDKEWALTTLNDKARVEIEALGLKTIDGYVYSKSENADPMTGSFSIDIKLNNARSLNVASGMFGKAEITTKQKNNVWKIPYEAILDGNANEGFVFVSNDEKTAIKTPVTLGTIDKNSVLVTEGLSGFKSLIVSGSAYLTDKSTIKIVK